MNIYEISSIILGIFINTIISPYTTSQMDWDSIFRTGSLVCKKLTSEAWGPDFRLYKPYLKERKKEKKEEEEEEYRSVIPALGK